MNSLSGNSGRPDNVDSLSRHLFTVEITKLTEKVKRGVKIFEVMSFKFFGNRRRRRPDKKLGEKMKLPLKKSSKIIFGWFFFGGCKPMKS